MALTVYGGSLVVVSGALGTGQGCCCGGCGDPCSKCNQSCISLSISGFSGSSEGPECEECDAINGTYTLVRGTGAPPTISPSIQDTSGTGAVITADLVFRPEDGGWTIGSVGVDKKGTCYTGDAKFAYTLTGAVVACDDEPVVTVEVERTEPLLTLTPADISLPAGTGAVLTPVYVPVVTTPGQETWAIESVSVTSGGVNYDNLQSVSIATKGCTKAVLNASLSIKVDVSKPTVTEAYVVPLKSSSQAAGAVVSIEWVPYDAPAFPAEGHLDGVQHWVPVGKIVSAGTGYAIGDSVNFEWPAKHFFAGGLYPTGVEFYLDNVASVGQNGQILGLDTTDAQDNWGLAAYYSDGTISSVTVADGGEYYTPGGIKSLTLVDGGTFWSTSPCRYSVCAPSGCKVNGEEQCRQISLSVGNEDNKLTISIAGSTLAEATLPAAGSNCGSLSFSAEEITSQCAKVGTITLSGTTCTSGPSQDSCCDPCTAPCDAENPCPPGCECVDGQCVPATGVCCIDGACDSTYTTQESCELCETVNVCTEYLFLEDPEQPCPEGWQGSGGFCQRTTNPASCEECAGECWSQQVGPCGKWLTDADCNASPNCADVPEICVDLGVPKEIPGTTGNRFDPNGRLWLFDPDGSDTDTIRAIMPRSGNTQFLFGTPLVELRLRPECGRWVLRWNVQVTNYEANANYSFEIDMGPVTDGECDPFPSASGTLYWDNPGVFFGPGNPFNQPPRSGSMQITPTITVGGCP